MTVWPDFVAWAVIALAAYYLLALLYMTLMFSEVGEKILKALAVVAALVVVTWAVRVVTT